MWQGFYAKRRVPIKEAMKFELQYSSRWGSQYTGASRHRRRVQISCRYGRFVVTTMRFRRRTSIHRYKAWQRCLTFPQFKSPSLLTYASSNSSYKQNSSLLLYNVCSSLVYHVIRHSRHCHAAAPCTRLERVQHRQHRMLWAD
jgi:hypothetical protein